MPDRTAHLDTLAIVSLVACSFLWGLNQVAAKAALAEIPPLLQATVRSIGGVLLVLLWSRLRGIPLFHRSLKLLPEARQTLFWSPRCRALEGLARRWAHSSSGGNVSSPPSPRRDRKYATRTTSPSRSWTTHVR